MCVCLCLCLCARACVCVCLYLCLCACLCVCVFVPAVRSYLVFMRCVLCLQYSFFVLAFLWFVPFFRCCIALLRSALHCWLAWRSGVPGGPVKEVKLNSEAQFLHTNLNAHCSYLFSILICNHIWNQSCRQLFPWFRFVFFQPNNFVESICNPLDKFLTSWRRFQIGLRSTLIVTISFIFHLIIMRDEDVLPHRGENTFCPTIRRVAVCDKCAPPTTTTLLSVQEKQALPETTTPPAWRKSYIANRERTA